MHRTFSKPAPRQGVRHLRSQYINLLLENCKEDTSKLLKFIRFYYSETDIFMMPDGHDRTRAGEVLIMKLNADIRDREALEQTARNARMMFCVVFYLVFIGGTSLRPNNNTILDNEQPVLPLLVQSSLAMFLTWLIYQHIDQQIQSHDMAARNLMLARAAARFELGESLFNDIPVINNGAEQSRQISH